MAGIKSLEELQRLRDQYKGSIDLRTPGAEEKRVRIAVGMATCGIASGARDTINAILEEVREQKLENVSVVQTGCMGYCYAEPVVEVRLPGQDPVLYGRIDAHRGKQIVDLHIMQGQVLKEWTLEGAGCSSK